MEKENNKVISAAFQFFTGDKPTFLTSPTRVVLGEADEKRILTKDNFSGF